jgi:hypothetical protein
MFEFFNFARKRRLSYDELQTLQMVAQQVVLSLESSVRIPGAAKKALALKFVGELLEQLGIVAPDSLIDVSIEAAVKLLKALDAQSLPPAPRQEPTSSPDQAIRLPSISGRPSQGSAVARPSDKTVKGLSL